MTKHLATFRQKISSRMPKMPKPAVERIAKVLDRAAGGALISGRIDAEILSALAVALVADMRAQQKQLLAEMEWMLDNRRAPSVFFEMQRTVQEAFDRDERWYDDMAYTR